MKRRQVLKSLGVGGIAGFGGCLATEPPARPYPDLPAMFDNPEYADRFRPHAPWNQHAHSPGRTRYNRRTSLPAGEIDAAWLRWIDDLVSARTAPVTDDHQVFVSHADADRQVAVTALDGLSGERRWTTMLESPDGRNTVTEEDPHGIAHVSGTVFYSGILPGHDATRLAALDTTDGTVRWQQLIRGYGVQDALTVGPDGIVLPVRSFDESTKDGLVAYGRDGAKSWEYFVGDSHVDAPVCLADESVYAALVDGQMIALDASDGSLIWRRHVVDASPNCPALDANAIQEGPAIDDERIYVVSDDYTLYAVTRNDGRLAWSRTLQETCEGTRSPPVIGEDVVYAWTGHGGLRALDPSDGTEEWRTMEIDGSNGLAATSEGVVAAGEDTVTALDTSGKRQWTFEMATRKITTDGDEGRVIPIIPRIVLAHDLVYVWLADGRLYAIGALT